MALWDGPFYPLITRSGKSITVDVTLSVNVNLGPNQAIAEVIAFFNRRKVKKVLDFGAGALRHSLPLLQAGFEVCAVDFSEQYANTEAKRVCRSKRAEAEAAGNFSAMVYPRQFIDDRRQFDAALLCFTLQGMPIAAERSKAAFLIHKKLKDSGYLVWMSRYGDSGSIADIQRVKDGHFKTPTGTPNYSFYREWRNEEIHAMLGAVGWRRSFHHLRSLGKGGRDQIFVYAKTKEDTWI